MKLLHSALLAATLPLALVAPVTPAYQANAQEAAQRDEAVQHDHIRTRLYGTAGPVVVLIPGMSTPAAVWDGTVASLVDDHRVLTVEVRGFAGERGTANESAGAIDGIVADISADLAARNLGSATIVGHSLGGLIAMEFGLAHAEQARSLVILDSLPFFGMVFAPDMTLEKVEPQAAQMRDMMIAGAEQMRAAGAKNTESGAGAAGMSIDEAPRVRIANWSLDAEPLAVAELVYEDTMTDLRSEIAGLKMPVTVVHMANGGYREMAIERYATDYAALPGVRLMPVDNSLHFVQLDQPEIVRAEIRAAAAK